MKKDIEEQENETWADLEIGLGEYSTRCASKDIFLKCLNDIKKNLREYLNKESEKIGSYKISSLYGFLSPGSFLDPEPETRYNHFATRLNKNVGINIITFNYTSTLERVLGYRGKPVPLSPLTTLNSIQHIHGTLNSMMAMGVNDSSQINNISLKDDLDIIEDFVKPEFNDACLNNKNSICESLIGNADLIVLYGTSLGLSDKKWWRLIGERMEGPDYPLLIYLPFDKKKDQVSQPNYMRRWTDGYVRDIRRKFSIQLDEKELSQKICVALNQSLFPLSKVIDHSTSLNKR